MPMLTNTFLFILQGNALVVDFMTYLSQLISVFNNERIIKIGQYLPKLCSNKNGPVFIARQHTGARYIDIANLSVRLSVRLSVCTSVTFRYQMKTYRYSFSPYGSPIILILLASNIFTKFLRGHPLRER